MHFVTTDGKLEIRNNTIIQKRLTNTRRRNIVLGIYFFVFFINQFLKEIDKLNLEGKQSAWIGLLLYGMILLLFILAGLVILVQQVLTNRLELSKISTVKLENAKNGLEKHLVVQTASKRYKVYKFRHLEKEYNRLIQHITTINPAIKIIGD